MKDDRLGSLIEAAMGPFPSGLAGEVIADVDLGLLDECIVGVASHYERNRRLLTTEHESMVSTSLHDLEAVYEVLPTDAARAHFDRTREVGQYLLRERTARH